MDEISFERFIALAELDQLVSQLTREQNTLVQEIESITQQIDNLHAELEEAYQRVYNIRKKIDSIELEVNAITEKKKRKQMQLESASNTKEYYSLEQELAILNKQTLTMEEPLFQAWHDFEQAQQIYEQKKTGIPPLVEQHQIMLTSMKNKVAHIQERREQYSKQRQNYEAAVSPELLQEYTSMKEMVANPVVPVIRDSCGACFYTITSSDLLEIKRDKLVKCKDCFRLLYMPRVIES
jgi:uncharacterized protein